MFDLGFSELVVIALVALIVLGPERLPKAARFAGLWIRRARAQWYSVRSELERELAAEELKRSLDDAKQAVRSTGESMRSTGEDLRRELGTIENTVRDTARDAGDALQPQPQPQPEVKAIEGQVDNADAAKALPDRTGAEDSDGHAR